MLEEPSTAFGHISAEKFVDKSQCDPDQNQKSIVLANLQAGIDMASGNGKYRFSLRQLYYAVRDYVQKGMGKALEWNWFCGIVTEYENEHGEIPGMTRDPRGILIHPHTDEEIPLGTIAVEKYARPAWNFNKILFIEKEGFVSILRELKWPERNDCAILTSKGNATRAVKDVLDLMGESDEELHFYCVHDADLSGTLIYQGLQEATPARAARKFKIHNLGLEPAEAVEMGLNVEHFDSKDKRDAADYVDQEWAAWLKNNRVELNAMTTPQFLAWLDRRMVAASAPGKLIPPEDVLREQLETSLMSDLTATITERVLREAGIDRLTKEAFTALGERVDAICRDITATVQGALAVSPEKAWHHPIAEISRSLAAIEPAKSKNRRNRRFQSGRKLKFFKMPVTERG